MFKKYTSIENTYRTEFLDRIKDHGYWDRTYVVQEKAHGANLSFWTTDGVSFYAAKRTEVLVDDEKFYNHQQVLTNHLERFRLIWTAINDDRDIEQMAIFGEVIGGNYPHQAVQKTKDAIKVQRGIFYSPDNEFYAFDIQVNRREYLDVAYVDTLFEENNVLHAQTLLEGSLEQCLEHPNLFPTTIPSQLGLPKITPNHCEGVIIRPKVNCYFNNGVRVILKNKNDKWAENIQHTKPVKQETPLSEKVVQLQEAVKSYVTYNRLNNVLSKIGEVRKSDFGNVMSQLNKDVIEDFAKDYQAFATLEKKDQKAVTKLVAQISSTLIREYFSETSKR